MLGNSDTEPEDSGADIRLRRFSSLRAISELVADIAGGSDAAYMVVVFNDDDTTTVFVGGDVTQSFYEAVQAFFNGS